MEKQSHNHDMIYIWNHDDGNDEKNVCSQPITTDALTIPSVSTWICQRSIQIVVPTQDLPQLSPNTTLSTVSKLLFDCLHSPQNKFIRSIIITVLLALFPDLSIFIYIRNVRIIYSWIFPDPQVTTGPDPANGSRVVRPTCRSFSPIINVRCGLVDVWDGTDVFHGCPRLLPGQSDQSQRSIFW